MPGRRVLLVLAAVAAVLGVVVLLVGGGDDDGLPPAPLAPTSTRADFSHVALPTVVGSTTTTTLPPGQGKVVFRGTVRTSDGRAVPAATVRAEWGVSAGNPEPVVVRTNRRGVFRIKGVYGGRWLVRAWRTPDFASTKPEVLFVEDGERRDLELVVEEVDSYAVVTDIEPDPPIVGHNTTLLVAFYRQVVDIEGRVEREPIAGMPVTVVGRGAWVIMDGEETQRTRGDGHVQWILQCESSGRQELGVETRVRTDIFDLAGCIPLSATSTTSTAPPPSTEAPPTTGAEDEDEDEEDED